jgi:hypothetical protein
MEDYQMKSLRESSLTALFIFLLCAIFFFLLNPLQTQAANAVFSVKSSVNASQVTAGSSVTINLAVSNTTNKTQTVNVLLAVTDSSGKVVYTKTWAGQSFPRSKTINYSNNYTMGANVVTGNYQVGVKLQNPNNSTTYYNNTTAAVFLVVGAIPTPTPTATPAPIATATPVPTATPTPTPTATATPVPTLTATPQSAGQWWQPTPDKPIHWHWQLSDDFVYPRDVLANVKVYDIDGEFATAATVASLHALDPNIKVICYFDAGVYETYRSDASRFPASVIGNPDGNWDGSYWLDIRQTDILLPIMQDRIQHWCKDKGFDAIEPDETEVWSNNSGFAITRDQNNLYNRKIAEIGHSIGLSVALKGNTTEAPDLWSYFDFTINEQCWQYNECDLLKSSFIDHGKAVLNIEYKISPDCATANSWHLNSARRDLNLLGPTNTGYRYAPCVADSVDNW